jgi:hypothetical protein
MLGHRMFERRMNKFMSRAPSMRMAAGVIVAGTTTVVVVSGLVMRFLDHGEFPDVWIGMWWAVQTVTTVGYGDIVPHNVSGRIVGTIVMLEGTAFVAIITAVITSSFVARASRELAAQQLREGADIDSVEGRLDVVVAKLEAIERKLDETRKPRSGSS